jgi:hypothetical protein
VSGEGRPYNPQACVVEGERIGIFIGSGYRYLTLEQAQQLRDQLDVAIRILGWPGSSHVEGFLSNLADLLAMYDAGISYTTADDGVHIEVDGQEIFAGFLDHPHGASELRKRVAELGEVRHARG